MILTMWAKLFRHLLAFICARLLEEAPTVSANESFGIPAQSIHARERYALPRFGNVFRPVAEFEGFKTRVVPGTLRQIEAKHGTLANTLDVALRRAVPGSYVTAQNGNVDVALTHGADVCLIFECKSDPGNIDDALYKAVGQLYVYRCLLENASDAQLVLVLPAEGFADSPRHTEVMAKLNIEVLFGDSAGNFATREGQSLESWITQFL